MWSISTLATFIPFYYLVFQDDLMIVLLNNHSSLAHTSQFTIANSSPSLLLMLLLLLTVVLLIFCYCTIIGADFLLLYFSGYLLYSLNVAEQIPVCKSYWLMSDII